MYTSKGMSSESQQYHDTPRDSRLFRWNVLVIYVVYAEKLEAVRPHINEGANS